LAIARDLLPASCPDNEVPTRFFNAIARRDSFMSDRRSFALAAAVLLWSGSCGTGAASTAGEDFAAPTSTSAEWALDGDGARLEARTATPPAAPAAGVEAGVSAAIAAPRAALSAQFERVECVAIFIGSQTLLGSQCRSFVTSGELTVRFADTGFAGRATVRIFDFSNAEAPPVSCSMMLTAAQIRGPVGAGSVCTPEQRTLVAGRYSWTISADAWTFGIAKVFIYYSA
jgi:hypothetical protein